MSIRLAFPGTALALLFALPALADATRDGIDASNAAFAAAAAKGDATAIADLYTEDAKLMPATEPNVSGRPAILKYWQGALSHGVGAVKFTTLEVYGRGATATEVGEFAIADKTGKQLDRGKYIVIWRRVDGSWKLHRDMYASSSAAPAK